MRPSPLQAERLQCVSRSARTRKGRVARVVCHRTGRADSGRTNTFQSDEESPVSMKRVILRADLTPQAKTSLESVCHRRGMTQLSVVSRMILWLSRQNDSMQKAVLGRSDDDASALLKQDLLRRLAGGK